MTAPDASFEEGFLTSRDGLRLYQRSLQPVDPKAHVAVVHGYGEHCGRYQEVMQKLSAAGFATHAFDYRGHGRSDGVRAHVDDFAHYLADVDVLVEHARAKAAGKKLFVLGHSLGGLILSNWLLGRRDGVAGAVLSSPFMGLAFAPPAIKTAAAQVLTVLLPRLHMSNGLQYEQLTRDRAIQDATRQDPLYQKVTTPRWFTEASRAQKTALDRAGEISLPCLMLLGEADPIASPAAGRRLFAGIGSKDKTLKAYPGFLHEVLNEVGREEVQAEVVSWYAQRV